MWQSCGPNHVALRAFGRVPSSVRVRAAEATHLDNLLGGSNGRPSFAPGPGRGAMGQSPPTISEPELQSRKHIVPSHVPSSDESNLEVAGMPFRQYRQPRRPQTSRSLHHHPQPRTQTGNRRVPYPNLPALCWQGSATVTSPSRRTGATITGAFWPRSQLAACTMRSLLP